MPFLPSIQPVFEKAPPFLPGQMATPISAPLSSTVRINQKSNVDGPDHAFQVNETLLYEHEFHGQSYVSCHLQRLQHGIFSSDSLHAKSPLHVSFVAVTFTFHPALSIAHRFTSAVIEITARDDSHQPLRFVKFAPHLAYGRISSESLKWSFQLGAALGVTQGPVNLSVNPTGKYETEKVIGTMMKIQGSTRSSHDSHHKRIADTKLVWSLEENDQQETGLPREFTFVFLVSRTGKTSHKKPHPHSAVANSNKSNSSTKHSDSHGEVPSSDTHHTPSLITSPIAHREADRRAGIDHDTVFGPMYLGITVKPQVSNTMSGISFKDEWEETMVDEEVGQKLQNDHMRVDFKGRMPSINSMTEGYYNFANMPGNFEDLIELPGNAITTKEPNLPEK
jgi:hypothetical protein